MKILALNATYRPKGSTTRLTEKALEGAASQGAQTEMVLLRDHDIRYCRNCLTCYKDLESVVGPCTIEDDVGGIVTKILEADGVILSSPVHMGFVTGLMVAFLERITFRLCKPTGEILGLKGCPVPRMPDKARAVASILSAGGMPPEMRPYCDTGTPWLKELGGLLFNGPFVGDMYAGALFTKDLDEHEWSRAFLFRELTDAQLREAFDLGAGMAAGIKNGDVRPFDPNALELSAAAGSEAGSV